MDFLDVINNEYGTELVMTCGACPVQIEGQVKGSWLYFRARYGIWFTAIADTLDKAIDGVSAECLFYREQQFGDSWLGIMPDEDLERILRECLDEFYKAY